MSMAEQPVLSAHAISCAIGFRPSFRFCRAHWVAVA